MNTTVSPRLAQDLPPGALLALRDAAGLVLHVHAGRVWVTRLGSLDDVFVAAGQCVTLQGRRVVIECDGARTARLQVVPAAAAAPAGWRPSWRLAWPRLARRMAAALPPEAARHDAACLGR